MKIKINELIAEHVMGWKRGFHNATPQHKESLDSPGEIFDNHAQKQDHFFLSFPGHDDKRHYLCSCEDTLGKWDFTDFSGDKTEVWEVVEVMNKKGYYVDIDNHTANHANGLYQSCFGRISDEGEWIGTDDSMEMSVCIAALLAVGISEKIIREAMTDGN